MQAGLVDNAHNIAELEHNRLLRLQHHEPRAVEEHEKDKNGNDTADMVRSHFGAPLLLNISGSGM